jgi:virginiamycin B lyase
MMSSWKDTAMHDMPRIAGAVLGAALIAGLGQMAPAENARNPIEITEWEVEAGGRPRDPFASGPDTVWFVGQAGDYLGRLTPSTGAIEIRPLDDEPGPHNLIVGSDGIVWYAGNLAGYIGRYDPATDEIERIEMPDLAAGDPHTMVFDAAEEHIWFTVQTGNLIGRLSLDDRSVELIEVPTDRARPYGIRTGPDGTVWVALVGTNKLASVDPETLELIEHEIPAEDARPRRLEVTDAGEVWYADYRRGVAGHFSPTSGAFSELALPGGSNSQPYGTALDDSGTFWLVETGVQPNRMIGVDTALGDIVSITPIPSGAGTVRHMHYYAPAREVWFGTDSSTIGRAQVARP